MFIHKRYPYGLLLSLLLCSQLALSGEHSLMGLDGHQHSLSEFTGQGKWVIFNVWAPRCPPCVEEAPELDSFYLDHKEVDALVVGLALDYPSFAYAKRDEVERFVEDYFVSFPVLLLDAELATEIFGVKLKAVPTTYIVNPAGQLAKRITGSVNQQELEEILERLKQNPQ